MERGKIGTRSVYVKGTDRFRCTVLFGTMIAGIFTLLVRFLDTRSCPGVNLEQGMNILTGVHCAVFLVLLFSYVFPKLMNRLGRIMSIFYFSLVISMICV